jgi:hypothetical protein
MKKKVIVGFYAVMFAMGMCVAAQNEAGIISKYSGRYSTLALDNQGKELLIAGHKVIRSQEDYVAFVSGIPKREIAMTKGFSGKSDDPLLAMPQINFSNQMMVAVIRDGSMYQPPDIESVVVSNGTLTINYSQRSLQEVAGLQEASGIGTYGAAIVQKVELKVEFKKRNILPQPPSANGDGTPAPEWIGNNLGKTTDQLRADPLFREHVSQALKHITETKAAHILKWREPYSYEVTDEEIRLGFRTTEKTQKHNYIVITIDKKTGKVKTLPRA